VLTQSYRHTIFLIVRTGSRLDSHRAIRYAFADVAACALQTRLSFTIGAPSLRDPVLS